jgi:hypothetical protein
VQHAEALLDNPKVRLTGYRVQLIIALLKQEHQRKELQEAAKQRKHDIQVLKLKAEQGQEPKPDTEAILAAARAQLQKGTHGNN